MSGQSKSHARRELITILAWFLFGVFVTIFLYPLYLTDFFSEQVFVKASNQSESGCWVLVKDSVGKTQGKLVGADGSTAIPVFAGEFSDLDFPENVQVTVLTDDYRMLDSRELETVIEVANGKIAQFIELKVAPNDAGQLVVTYSEVSP